MVRKIIFFVQLMSLAGMMYGMDQNSQPIPAIVVQGPSVGATVMQPVEPTQLDVQAQEKERAFDNQVVWDAYEQGRKQDILDAIDEGLFNIDQIDDNGETLLLRASKDVDLPFVDELLTRQANTAIPDSVGVTPFEHAIVSGNTNRGTAIVVSLLRAGFNPNIRLVRSHCTPLVYAINTFNKRLADVLLQRKARFDIPDSRGYVPLLYAIDCNNVGAVRLLLSLGANPNVRISKKNDAGVAKYEESALELSAQKAMSSSRAIPKAAKITKMLLANGAREGLQKALETVANNENTQEMFAMLAATGEFNVPRISPAVPATQVQKKRKLSQAQLEQDKKQKEADEAYNKTALSTDVYHKFLENEKQEKADRAALNQRDVELEASDRVYMPMLEDVADESVREDIINEHEDDQREIKKRFEDPAEAIGDKRDMMLGRFKNTHRGTKRKYTALYGTLRGREQGKTPKKTA